MPKRKPYHCFGCGKKCTDEYTTDGGNPVCAVCEHAYAVAVAHDERRAARDAALDNDGDTATAGDRRR